MLIWTQFKIKIFQIHNDLLLIREIYLNCMSLLLLSFNALQHFDVKYILIQCHWHVFATESCNYHWIHIHRYFCSFQLIWSAFTIRYCVRIYIIYHYTSQCNGLLHRPIPDPIVVNSNSCCVPVWIHLVCLSAHMLILRTPHRLWFFCYCICYIFSIALQRSVLGSNIFTFTFTIRRCYSVVLTVLMHLHHNNSSIFSLQLNIYSCYTNAYREYRST